MLLKDSLSMGLEFKNISHAYGTNEVLSGIDLMAEAGEVTCLVGPSGCGKTTLLKLAAGLMQVQNGEITLSGEELASSNKNLPPEKRPVGLVFQEGALFPHMSVADNIAFGLTGAASEKKERVADLLGKIGLSDFEARFPHTLSGGQQQRIALARALAPSPKVLLLDEPFANIDSQLRRSLREETRRMLKESGTVAILVTHDPEEALEMGDRIAVLDAGQVAQFDVPQALFDRPATAGIAKMFGRGQSLSAKLSGEGFVETSFGHWPASCLSTGQLPNTPLELVVRQEIFDLAEQSDGQLIVDLRRAGKEQLVFVEGSDGEVLRVEMPGDREFNLATRVSLQPKAGSVHCFPANK